MKIQKTKKEPAMIFEQKPNQGLVKPHIKTEEIALGMYGLLENFELKGDDFDRRKRWLFQNR